MKLTMIEEKLKQWWATL